MNSSRSNQGEAPPPVEGNRGKVVLIGWDGADFNLLQPLIDAGDLPHLRSLQQQGAWGRLASTLPALSALAWPSCFTGVNPGKHGVFGFTRFDPLTYQASLCQSTDVQAPALWHLLGETGRRSIVINVPMTFPPEPLKGVLISGMFPSPHTDYIYPYPLREEIHREVGLVMREPSINLLRRARPPRQLELLNEVADQQRDLVLYLTRTQPWDLCFVVFRTTDHAHHAFLGTAAEEVQGTYRLSGSTGEVIRRHYQHLDTLLGELVEHVPEATFMVMSDHGTALQPYTLYLNEWLRQEGLLTWLPFFSRSHLGGCTRERTVGRWLRSLRLQFLSPWFSKETLTRSVRLPAVDKILSSQGGVQWSQTQVFLDLAAVSAFRLNVQEREGQGTVAPDGPYEELREKLITRLPQLRHPHLDEPAIESVNRREEVYQGPFAHRGPDLLIVTREDRYRIQDRRSSGAVFGPTPRRSWGQHHRHGIVLLAGSPVRCAELGLSQMVDIAPTVLYLLGHPIPAHVDGRVLTEAIKPKVLDERPVRRGPPEKDWLRTPTVERYEDEAAIRRHLQDLGYL